jgi:hypothetical protein
VRLIPIIRALQKKNRQAHHDWAQAHQQELQQLRVIVSQSQEIILSSRNLEEPINQAARPIEKISPSSESRSPANTNQTEATYQKSKSLSKRQNRLKARFLIPGWLFGVSRAIEIYETRANAGWNFHIQMYNVVPYDSPIFKMAEDNCVFDIQQLFSTGQASPFDRDEYGWTVLDVRIR